MLSSDPRSRHDLEIEYLPATNQKGHLENADFLTKCVFQVVASRGDEAPGEYDDVFDPIEVRSTQ